LAGYGKAEAFLTVISFHPDRGKKEKEKSSAFGAFDDAESMDRDRRSPHHTREIHIHRERERERDREKEGTAQASKTRDQSEQ
jgi:hypothetical protein